MVDGQLAGPVSDILAKIIADAVTAAQAALEQYEAQLIATNSQALAAQADASATTIADLNTQLATATAALADATAQLTAANAALAQLTPPSNSGIPAAPAEGELTATDKLAAAVRAVAAQ
jgi:hypothetical protein